MTKLQLEQEVTRLRAELLAAKQEIHQLRQQLPQQQPQQPQQQPSNAAPAPASFDTAYAAAAASGGPVSLVDLRRAMPVTRPVFDALLRQLRIAGRYTLESAEGHHGLTTEERAAAIEEHGDVMLYVSRRS